MKNYQRLWRCWTPRRKAPDFGVTTSFHRHPDEGLECDILVDTGDFILLEEGDDPKAVALYDGGEPIDLTDVEARCYEYVELSEDETVFELYLVTGDDGGPSFFVPNEPWIGSEFLAALMTLSATASKTPDSPDHIIVTAPREEEKHDRNDA
jgi:hypothetical protein